MLKAFFRQSDIPLEYRSNFANLYYDIGWFGILSGSAVNFLNVFAARQGATGLQIGLLAAVSGIVNLIFAIPAARWLEKRKVDRAVFWTSVAYRIGFALWIPLPWLFNPQGQVWALIIIALYMGIPLTALSVGFNALFASAVPEEWRAHVAGRRNMVLSLAFICSSLGSGYILNHMPFPQGYQLVFMIGFIGAAMSSFHIFFIRPLGRDLPQLPAAATVSRGSIETRPRPWLAALRLDIWRSWYRKPLLVLLGFHTAQYLAIPLFSLYMVNVMHLKDQSIGVGNSLFYLAVMLGSTQLNRLVHHGGHHIITGYGAIGLAVYPLLMAFSSQVWQFYTLSVLGGLAWALVGGSYANYLLERTPAHDRPSHLAWYNVVLNGAILFGSLAGPAIADVIGLAPALILAGVLRFAAGAAILKWG
jgi:MFS family permease